MDCKLFIVNGSYENVLSVCTPLQSSLNKIFVMFPPVAYNVSQPPVFPKCASGRHTSECCISWKISISLSSDVIGLSICASMPRVLNIKLRSSASLTTSGENCIHFSQMLANQIAGKRSGNSKQPFRNMRLATVLVYFSAGLPKLIPILHPNSKMGLFITV